MHGSRSLPDKKLSLLRPGISVANVAGSGLPDKLLPGSISKEQMLYLGKEIKIILVLACPYALLVPGGGLRG